jgi:hypothetical protein
VILMQLGPAVEVRPIMDLGAIPQIEAQAAGSA